MQQIIFYSWQSDLENSTNRSFIERCLENAITGLKSDTTLKVEPVLDRDTAGVGGSPDIGLTIFSKISNATVFVCDISIINKPKTGRPTPNPNVLLELGYALKTMGASRIIMVMNTPYGGPDLLPFDLKQKRVLTYTLTKGADKTEAKKQLSGKFAEAIKIILQEMEELSTEVQVNGPATHVIEAIKNKQPDANRTVHNYMKWLAEELKKLDPRLLEGEADEKLVESINKSLHLVKTFDNVANAISAMDASAQAHAITKNFENILTNYFNVKGFSGSYKTYDFDFFKFVGHEIFVIFIAFLIKDGRWKLLNDVLQNKIHIENHSSGSAHEMLPYSALVAHLSLLDEIRSQRLQTNNQRRKSIHADLLKERHEHLPLAENITWHDFMDADFFLFFHSYINLSNEYLLWWPRTWVYMGDRIPRFLIEAFTPNGAKDLSSALGLKSVAELKPNIKKAVEAYKQGMRNSSAFGSDALRWFDAEKISDI